MKFIRAPEYLPGMRESQAEFDTPDHQLLRTSITRRPDAVSFDYLWSYAFGPVAIGDVTQGLRNRPWYVRAEGLTVYVARANDANDAWEEEEELFTYTGAEIVELDLAFEQQGRPVMVAERHTGTGDAPHLWIYWFDPVNGFVFQDFGPGRTPRCILDNVVDVTDSDVLVFYVSDDDDDVRMRVQREVYATAHSVPITDVEHKALEDVVKVSDSRIRVVVSVRDPMAHTYSLESLESTLYPQFVVDQPVLAELAFVDAVLVKVVIDVGWPDPVDAYWSGPTEAVDAALYFVAAALVDAIINVGYDTDPGWKADEVNAALEFIGATLVSAVIEVSPTTDPRWAAEEVNAALEFIAAELVVVVIVVEQTTSSRWAAEEVNAELSFVSATLVTP